jgi:hypothetical protein
MKLLHRAKLIGLIKNVGPDEMGLAGNIELLPEAEPFKPFFDFLIDEERNHEEPPFSEELLEGWSIEDDHGVEREIFAPAVDNNYTTIEWRW